MVQVKRSAIVEQLESHKDQLAAIAEAKEHMVDCKVIADKAFKAQLALQLKLSSFQLALHDSWK